MRLIRSGLVAVMILVGAGVVALAVAGPAAAEPCYATGPVGIEGIQAEANVWCPGAGGDPGTYPWGYGYGTVGHCQGFNVGYQQGSAVACAGYMKPLP